MTERIYLATQTDPPFGPWHMRLQQGDYVLEDNCEDEHKAGAREDLERRLDAKINPPAEPELPLGVVIG